jgi:glycerol kinase
MWTVSDVRDAWRERRRYEPRMGEDERATLLAGWSDALGRARSSG